MFKLTEKQQEIINSNARIKLVMGAMRSGKTITALYNMFEALTTVDDLSGVAIFLVKSNIEMRNIVRQIKKLKIEIILSIKERDKFTLITTTIGDIYVATDYIDGFYCNITIDNATSNKHFVNAYKNATNDLNVKLSAFGHIPENINNAYFKIWLREYFSSSHDVEAFLFNNTFTNANERQDALIRSVGKARHNRDYLGIPDYVDYDADEKQIEAFKPELLGKFHKEF